MGSVALPRRPAHLAVVALPHASDDAFVQPAPPDPNRKRRRLLVAVASALFGGSLALGAFIASGPLVRSLVIERAALLGLTLEPGSISFGWGWLRLDQARFTLEGTNVLAARAERVVIKLESPHAPRHQRLGRDPWPGRLAWRGTGRCFLMGPARRQARAGGPPRPPRGARPPPDGHRPHGLMERHERRGSLARGQGDCQPDASRRRLPGRRARGPPGTISGRPR